MVVCVRYVYRATAVKSGSGCYRQHTFLRYEAEADMGLYDREYASAGSPPDLREKFASSSMAVKLVVITFAIYLIDNLFFSRPTSPQGIAQLPLLTEYMSIRPGLFQGNWNLWQLLTYGFAHAPMGSRSGIMHIAGNMYGLWFFGREVEKKYGSREFLGLYLGLIVFSALIWCFIKIGTAGAVINGLMGASGAIAGLIVLYALHFPKRKLMLMFFPVAMPAWVLGLLIVGSDIMGAAGMRGDRIAFVVHLAGAALGAAYFYSGIRLTDGLAGFSLPKPRKGPKLKVHRPRDQSLDLKADKILEKISREGAESVTAAERKVLDEYSRRVRNRRG